LIIRKKRIKNPQRYLYMLQPEDKFYIAVQLEREDYSRLEEYGLRPNALPRIPRPRHTVTKMNADGLWKPIKSLPKEVRAIEHDFHIIDWHGQDHYGTCWQSRWCYPREYIAPTKLVFTIEDGVLYSPLMVNNEAERVRIKAAMNIALEMLGRCEVWTAERVPAVPPIKQVEVPWEILRAGTDNQSEWSAYLEKITDHKPEGQRAVICRRHEYLWQMVPDFCVLGTQNFWGYVVYGFSALNLYVFECNSIDNATYVFKGEWKNASQLTKGEVLSGHLQEARIYHTENWYDKIGKMLAAARAEVA